MKAFSEACERNQEPILRVLREVLKGAGDVLEIGSGTGQHAAYFGPRLPHLQWRPSDLAENHASICAWTRGIPNVAPPLLLDVESRPWPVSRADAVFTANTVHIIAWSGVCALFEGAAGVLAPGGLLCLYGPVNYGGRYTSPSNAQFDQWLKRRDPLSGIRDFEALERLAAGHGLVLLHDHAMPANNRLLVWRSGTAA